LFAEDGEDGGEGFDERHLDFAGELGVP
jgi:hypothetical protein